MTFTLKYSWRNLFRSPRRSLLMILGLALSSGFMVWNLNLSASSSQEIMRDFLKQFAGYATLTHPKYYDLENPKKFDKYQTIGDADFKSLPGTPRVTALAYLAGEKKTAGSLMVGVDVEKESSQSTLSKALSEGRFLDPAGTNEILLGRRLAQRLHIKLNDRIGIIGQAVDGSVMNELMLVVGILDFGGGEFEEVLSLTQLKSAQMALGLGDRYHQRVLFEKSNPVVSEKIKLTPWNELLPEVDVSVRFLDAFAWLISFIICIVVALGLANTLMITFFEREDEFVTLNILGAPSSWIARTLIFEVIILAFIALVCGGLVGHLSTKLFYFFPINLAFFSGGKPLIVGGISLMPKIRMQKFPEHYVRVFFLVLFFLTTALGYPLLRVIKRSRKSAHAATSLE